MALATNEREFSSCWTVPPRWATPRTPERPSYGPAVAAVSELVMRRPLMPHQREILDVFLEVQAEDAGDPEPGQWAYRDGTVTIERRGGKTSLLSPVFAHRARLVERASLWMTAQTRDKARGRWLDITEDLRSSALRDDVRRKIGNMHEELLWLDTGAKLRPFAPNEDALHSETPDLVALDEVWAFGAEQARQVKAGYVPAMATTAGQALKLSTAGTERSTWLAQLVRDGRAAVESGTRLGKFYYEHSLPDRVDVGGGSLVRIRDLSDEQLIEACIANHPAICHVPDCPGPRMRRPCPHGFTILGSVLWSDWDELADRSEFLRGYGNRAAADLSTKWQAIAEATWLDRVDVDGIPESARVALGVWVSEETGEDCALSVGWRDVAGRMHVEIPQLEDRPTVFSGLEGVVPAVEAIGGRHDVATVAVPNVKAGRDLADRLEQIDGLQVLRVSQADVAAACARHRSELRSGTWWHRQSTQATAAASAADWTAGRWGEPGDPISALGAQTLAGWGFDHAPPPPPPRRKFRVR